MIKNNQNRFGLTERDMKTFQTIFGKYSEVKEVYVFGSRAKGNYKPGSDIDLAVMNDGADTKTIARLLSDFEESSLPIKVDLINFPVLKHNELIEHIKRAGVVFYKLNESKNSLI